MNHRTWTYSRILAPFVMLLLGSGCTMIQAQSRVDPQTVASYGQLKIKNNGSDSCVSEKLKGDTRAGAIDLDCLRFPEEAKAATSGMDFAPAKIGSNGVLAYAAAQVDDKQRNRLAAILMKQSDDVCTQEMARLTANEAMTNAGLSIIANGLSTTSAIVSGVLSKSILAGGASFANATRGHIDAEVYRNALSSAIGKAISIERDDLRGKILLRYSDKTDVYSVDQMIMEVNRYHQGCSFYRGLQLVVEAVNKTEPSAAARGQGLTNAINALDQKIAYATDKASRASAGSDAQTGWNAEVKTLIAKHTALVAEQANGTAGSATANPTPPSPAPGPAEAVDPNAATDAKSKATKARRK